MTIVDVHRSRGGWTQVIVCGLVSGAIINILEFLAHRVWLDAKWNAAFAALGKTPSFWGTFVAANFFVGVLSVLSYRWLSRFYASGKSTAAKIAAAMWVIFWVIPIAGLQPFGIFPDYLLVLVIAVGVLDAAIGIFPALIVYDRLK
jgi:hypothetical protein